MMPIMFNSLLKDAGLNLSDVRLLRHKDTKAARGRSLYELWRDHPSQFDLYQSMHGARKRAKLTAKYWTSFLGTPGKKTMFIGVYAVKNRRTLEQDIQKPHKDGFWKTGICDVYDLVLEDMLADLIGKLFIDWGSGERVWIQRPDRQNKPLVELRKEFKEPEFPGFLNFIKPLSEINVLPRSWITALQSSRGIYLFTCPRTKEQYVGSASGQEGFWGRWQGYVQSGDGGNKGLKSREPSDYQVSILEVAGSALERDDILRMEELWKVKLQSKAMGLNR